MGHFVANSLCCKTMIIFYFYTRMLKKFDVHDSTSDGQSRDTQVVISHDLFTFCARLKVCFTIIFLAFWWSSEMTPSAEYPDLEVLCF